MASPPVFLGHAGTRGAGGEEEILGACAVSFCDAGEGADGHRAPGTVRSSRPHPQALRNMGHKMRKHKAPGGGYLPSRCERQGGRASRPHPGLPLCCAVAQPPTAAGSLRLWTPARHDVGGGVRVAGRQTPAILTVLSRSFTLVCSSTHLLIRPPLRPPTHRPSVIRPPTCSSAHTTGVSSGSELQ